MNSATKPDRSSAISGSTNPRVPTPTSFAECLGFVNELLGKTDDLSRLVASTDGPASDPELLDVLADPKPAGGPSLRSRPSCLRGRLGRAIRHIAGSPCPSLCSRVAPGESQKQLPKALIPSVSPGWANSAGLRTQNGPRQQWRPQRSWLPGEWKQLGVCSPSTKKSQSSAAYGTRA